MDFVVAPMAKPFLSRVVLIERKNYETLQFAPTIGGKRPFGPAKEPLSAVSTAADATINIVPTQEKVKRSTSDRRRQFAKGSRENLEFLRIWLV
jgi:hypothetical protein